jgi:hypothetical protein
LISPAIFIISDPCRFWANKETLILEVQMLDVQMCAF